MVIEAAFQLHFTHLLSVGNRLTVWCLPTFCLTTVSMSHTHMCIPHDPGPNHI